MLAQDHFINEAPLPNPPSFYELAYESLGGTSITILIIGVLFCGYLTSSKLRIQSRINYNLRWVLTISFFVGGWLVFRISQDVYIRLTLFLPSHSTGIEMLWEALWIIESWIFSFLIVGLFIVFVSACMLTLNIREKKYNKRLDNTSTGVSA